MHARTVPCISLSVSGAMSFYCKRADLNDSIEMPVTAQLTHTPQFFFWTGKRRKCRGIVVIALFEYIFKDEKLQMSQVSTFHNDY